MSDNSKKSASRKTLRRRSESARLRRKVESLNDQRLQLETRVVEMEAMLNPLRERLARAESLWSSNARDLARLSVRRNKLDEDLARCRRLQQLACAQSAHSHEVLHRLSAVVAVLSGVFDEQHFCGRLLQALKCGLDELLEFNKFPPDGSESPAPSDDVAIIPAG